MKLFPNVFLILFCVTAFTCAQSPQKNLSQLSAIKVEPFKIETGSSFSASSGSENFSSGEIAAENNREAVYRDFAGALEIIRENYVDGKKLSLDELTKSSITTMLRSLDPHSNFYEAREYQELLSDEQSEYSGIGISIANYVRAGQSETYVTSTFPGSAAMRASLHFGDKIISIDGEKISGKNSLYARGKIRGEKNSIVRMTIERASTNRIETVDIRRAVVTQPSIPDAYLLRSGIGYIDLTNGFNYTTLDEFNRALDDLHHQGINSLILDLRGNPGGLVEQAVKVAEKFLPAGQIVLTQRGRIEIDNRVWKSFNKTPEKISLVLLVNGGSASATEIVTGALQDYDRAMIIGEKTFGKGLVQSVLNLPGGAGLTLTTARYFTPSGRSIQRDYSQGNLYDYFQRRINYNKSAINQTPSKTTTGRNVYGGDGITPDEIVKDSQLTAAQSALLDPIFFFARDLANGRVVNFENFKTIYPVHFGKRIQAGDFPIGDDLLNAFRNFLQQKNFKISAAQFEANKNFIAVRLRFELATAAYGNVAANQVLIENDLQVKHAVEALPRAKNLANFAKQFFEKK